MRIEITLHLLKIKTLMESSESCLSNITESLKNQGEKLSENNLTKAPSLSLRRLVNNKSIVIKMQILVTLS